MLKVDRTPVGYHELALQSYNNLRKGFSEHLMVRGLWDTPQTGPEQSYVKLLGTFGGLNVAQLISRRIEEKQVMGDSSPVTLLDLGFGQGHALLDSRLMWGNRVQLVGYGDTTYTKLECCWHNKKQDRYLITPPTHDLLQAADVELIEGNITQINAVLGDRTFDFILSVHMMCYLEFPHWELIKKIYKQLNENGIAMLQSVSVMLIAGGYGYLFPEVMERYGYLFETNYHPRSFNERRVSFQKTHSTIKVPIGSIGTPSDDHVRMLRTQASWFTGTAGATHRSDVPAPHQPIRWSDQLD